MSEWNDFLGDAFSCAANAVGMGEDATLNGHPVRVIADQMHRTSVASQRGGGRMIEITGIVRLSKSDWDASGARQGSTLILGIGEMRVTNTPNEAESVITLEISGVGQP